jgi:hypothetical protein
MPIEGSWTAYVDAGIITYYKGDLAKAKRFSMHLCRPYMHILRLSKLYSAFAVICDEGGRNTLYFWDLDNPGDARSSLERMAPGGLDVFDLMQTYIAGPPHLKPYSDDDL